MMLDPTRPDYIRIFITSRIDHLADADNSPNPQPICGRRTSRPWWDQYPPGTDKPYMDVRLCVGCEVEADKRAARIAELTT